MKMQDTKKVRRNRNLYWYVLLLPMYRYLELLSIGLLYFQVGDKGEELAHEYFWFPKYVSRMTALLQLMHHD